MVFADVCLHCDLRTISIPTTLDWTIFILFEYFTIFFLLTHLPLLPQPQILQALALHIFKFHCAILQGLLELRHLEIQTIVNYGQLTDYVRIIEVA